MFKRFVISGTKKNDDLPGTGGLDIMFGKKGNDTLHGLGGNDFLFGGKGNDLLEGGADNDFLFGGKGKDQLFGGDGNDKLFGGKGNDFLDGGAGSDYLFGGKGNDTFNFNMSENADAKDFYDGGKGRDTLQLTLTSAQLDNEFVQKDIADFEAFLARKGHGDDGKVFEFKSFNLSVRNFQDLKIVEVEGGNTAPVANPDGVDPAILVSEDAVDFSLDVLANDIDADGNTLELVTAMVADGLGTAAVVGDRVVYNPGDAYQFLGAGASANVRIDYTISDGTDTASSFAQIQVNGVNDAPRALSASINTTATVDGRISVAVVGVSGPSSHEQAAGQLDPGIFTADWETLAIAKNWTADSLMGYEVVVLGGSAGVFDYAATIGTGTALFESLNDFVSKGGGVVTTGFFASQLRNMSDPAKTLADNITPIASVWNNENDVNAQITVVDPSHAIVKDVPSVYLSNAVVHEFAPVLDGGLTPLATAQFGGATVTAIAYAENVLGDGAGLPGGRTAYLGAPYVAEPSFAAGLDTDVLSDQIFEQAVAWAAGARSVQVTIDDLILLANFEDVDSPPSSLAVHSVSLIESNGATIGFDDNGDIVYSLQGNALEQFLLNGSITANFEYTVSDGTDVSAAASVSLLVNQDVL